MSGVNKVILVGHLGQDPDLRSTNSGSPVCNLSVATSFKGKGGEEKTEWHRVVAWGKTAELCGQYLAKGRLVYVEGRLETRQWEKDGVKRYTTEVVANGVVFLSGGEQGTQRPPVDDGDRGHDDLNEDDIPF